MKAVSISLLAASLTICFSTAALAEKQLQNLEPIGASYCGGVKVDDRYNRNEYLVNDKGQVKIDLEMEDARLSDQGGQSDSFRTNVIQSLTVKGKEIVHTPTGMICAEFKKSAPIGGKSWVGNWRCQIKTAETKYQTFDSDGFATGKGCTREYFFGVRPKTK